MSKKNKNIKLQEYQDWVRQMWAGGKDDLQLRDLYIMSTGLGGETGEVLEILKKAVRADKDPDLDHLTEEIGDVLYYLTMLCNYHEISLIDVLHGNVDKINVRYAHHSKK